MTRQSKISYVICIVCIIVAIFMAALDTGIIRINIGRKPDVVYEMTNKYISWD